MRGEKGLLAAIGIGSNSVRLLIARHETEGRAGKYEAVERMETVTRLASYHKDEHGKPLLREEAIANTQVAVGHFARHAQQQGALLIGVLATQAVRAASNSQTLISLIKSDPGLDVGVISGEQEATFGWRAVSELYATSSDAISVGLASIDIGGGSTDLAVGSAGSSSPVGVVSIPAGGRSVMTRYALDVPVTPSQITGIVDALGVELGPRASALYPRPQKAVVIGGTAAVLSTMRHFASPHLPENTAIERVWLQNWLVRMAGFSLRKRIQAGVPPERADIIVAGGALLLALLDTWQLADFYVTQRNILDGFIEKAASGHLLQ